MVYRSLHGLAPGYPSCKFERGESAYILRDSKHKAVNVLLPRTNYYKNSFSYSGAILWISLPCDLGKQSPWGNLNVNLSLRIFKPCLKNDKKNEKCFQSNSVEKKIKARYLPACPGRSVLGKTLPSALSAARHRSFSQQAANFGQDAVISLWFWTFILAASDEEISVKNPAFMMTAALTHACQMVELMAYYLDVNLPKRINYR